MAVEVGDLRIEALARGRIALSRAQQGEPDVADAEAAMRIARTTRDRFVASSVYFNIGYLFDRLGDPARAGEILVDEGLPLLAELGLPTVALSGARGLVPVAGGPLGRGPPGRGHGRPRRRGASAVTTSPSR